MKKLLFGLFLYFSISHIYAQELSPMEVCKKVFSRDSLSNLKHYCTDEYEGHPNGLDINPGVKLRFRQLSGDSATAVINLTITDTSGFELDTYLHLKKDTTWKIAAFRALALTGMLQQMYDELKKMTPAQINKMIAMPLHKGKDYRIFKSREDYSYLLNNTALTLASDDNIIAHFQKNKGAFEQLKVDFLNSPPAGKRNFIKASDDKSALSNKLKALYLHSAEINGEETTNTVILNIGGIVDNHVGYMYVKDNKDVPKMSDGHFIMIRSLGDGWYLYKTT